MRRWQVERKKEKNDGTTVKLSTASASKKTKSKIQKKNGKSSPDTGKSGKSTSGAVEKGKSTIDLDKLSKSPTATGKHSKSTTAIAKSGKSRKGGKKSRIKYKFF